MTAALASAACDDGGSAEPERPPEVPKEAAYVERIDIGEPAAFGDPESSHTLTAMRCNDGVLVVETSRETIHAELPCDRMPDQQIIDAYAGAAAQVELEWHDDGTGCAGDGECGKLFIQSATAGSLEFTVRHTWLEE
jgi:hypothetical protein